MDIEKGNGSLFSKEEVSCTMWILLIEWNLLLVTMTKGSCSCCENQKKYGD